MSILIDGYNVIYASRKLGSFMDDGRIEKARHGLVSLLARYSTHRREEITVVFDGRTGHYPDSGRKTFTFEKVKVLFTGREKLADDRILELAAADPNPGEITVITTDRALAAGVRRTGAHTRESLDYLKDVMAKVPDEDGPGGHKGDVPYISYEEYMNMLKEHESSSEDS